MVWLMGRERGIGLVPMLGEHAGHLLLVLGDPSSERWNDSFLLTPEAVDSLHDALERYRETGKVIDPKQTPSVSIWGDDEMPRL